MKRTARILAAGVVVLWLGAPAVLAQQYPPPPPTPDAGVDAALCVNVDLPAADVVDGVARVEVGSGFSIEGSATTEDGQPCASQGANVLIWGESPRIDFDEFAIANEDGSFRWPQQDGDYDGPRIGALAQLPTSWTACERYRIVVEVEGVGVAEQPVQLLGPDGTLASCTAGGVGGVGGGDEGTAGLGGDGTQVLGGTIANDAGSAGAGGEGTLPFTGGNLVLLILWAIGLIGVGTLMVVAVWRRVRARAARLPATLRGSTPALPAATVPRLDTTDFIESRIHHHEKPASRRRPSREARERVRRRLESETWWTGNRDS